MTFYLIYFSGCCFHCTCTFFWCRCAVFRGSVRTISVSSFLYRDNVHNKAKMSLKQAFSSSSMYDIDNLFFILNYCPFYRFIYFYVFYHIIILNELIKPSKVFYFFLFNNTSIAWTFLFSHTTCRLSNLELEKISFWIK